MFLKRKEHNSISIFVAIGANLFNTAGESPLQICERAVRDVAALPGLHGAVRSRWFSSAPIPDSEQPRYINGILHLKGENLPLTLLSALQAIEERAGRLRGEQNAARTLDLDIIDMGGMLRDLPDPILPHPRAHLRAFVLMPLRDVAPGWVHPRLEESVESLLAKLPAQDIRAVGANDDLRTGVLAPR
jgi:2-amino-4-hydroxy-6-hydroxymethyldihydropteridine diphosphokinase